MSGIIVPSWVNGELLSAYKLNQLSASVNEVVGAARSPSGIFCVRGTNQTWYMRRRFRYLHVAYTATLTGDSLDVSVNFGTASYNYTHGVSVAPQWRTYDLLAVGGTVIGDWYSITVSRDGNDFSFTTDLIIESESNTPTSNGTFTAAPTWASGEAVGDTKLNSLSACVTQFDDLVNLQGAVMLRGTGDGQSYYVKRRGRYLQLAVTVGGTSPDVNIYVHATKVLNDPVTGVYSIDLATLSPSPAVNTWYLVRFEKLAGSGELLAFRELPDTVYSGAPSWSHGESGFLSKINSYATLLSSANATLGVVGWQVAAIHRPYDHPRWTIYKNRRYLHYMRNGATPAIIVDPEGEFSATSLTRTTSATPFATFDLDTLDWLAPGGMFYVEEADVVWMSDDA
jgi:hypothetical protein